MKRIIMLTALALLVVIMLSGCSMVPLGTPVNMGNLYTNISYDASGYWQNDISNLKVGKASCSSVLGVVATGDASIQAAMQEAGIKKIHHIDYNKKSILGVFITHTTIVYGE